MRILTVRQPWAWAIIHGGKDVENRVRNIAGGYRGPVAIHAALADAENAPDALWVEHTAYLRGRDRRAGLPPLREFDASRMDRGAIIGVVDLVGVHDSRIDGCGTRRGVAKLGELIPLCSEWAEPWAHHLVLANPRPLGEPIPFRGALGLRELDPATTTRVLEALAA